MHATQNVRLAVDIGGTFTDVVLEAGGAQYTLKTLTTHEAPERGILKGFHEVLSAASLHPGSVSLIVYGTTLATNLLIERNGSPTALITTEGFRDSIEMRNENRYEQYDLDIDLPAPLVPRSLRFPVRERMNAHGKILLPLEEASVLDLVPKLAKHKVRSIAIGFLHSYANNLHEQLTRDILKKELPELEITLSSEVSPEMREYERISTACANAYVQPLMSRHLKNLEKVLGEEGFACPLFLMLSGGGITTLKTAIQFPVRLVESGPAGGAIFAAHIAKEMGFSNVLSFDMGGTTAKICLIDNAEPQTTRTFEVARVYRFMKGSGIPLRIPVLEMVEIGAGGGSLAHLDSMGRIAVGPQSAGSDPGPACYGLGGKQPAVTDADVVLGRIDPENFAGGNLKLDSEKAIRALQENIGETLGMEAAHAALGVSEMVEENMANAARMHAIESGKVIEERSLIAFGGAAPLHAVRLAEKLDIDQVIIPPGAGVGSAIGFLRAPVAYEVIRSQYQRLSALGIDEVNALLHEMRTEAHAVVESGAFGQPLVEQLTAYMRYVGQGHEVGVEIPVRVKDHVLDQTAAQNLKLGFEKEYNRLYERSIPDLDIEVLTWVLLLSTEKEIPRQGSEIPSPQESISNELRFLMDTDSGQFINAPVYSRAKLLPGARVSGPAVILENDTATVLNARFEAEIHPFSYIVLTRKREA
ncbi:MAG: hydantoinase/oxoprolinase family protein [SAR324 cluster bacterium]|nr:hydantoinase/oxoprolinase family protein [SAR324 cluster bacterium]